MSRVVLSIGSNIGDREAHLRSVVDALGDRVRAVSPVYRTPPWGGVDQSDFLNAVVIAEDPIADCWAWLRRGQRLERAANRERIVRWGARTLDVDVITCTKASGRACLSDDPDLTLPHPYAHYRAFVLVPWLDADPAATLPGPDGAEPVARILDRLGPDARVGIERTDVVLDAGGQRACS